MQIQIKQQHIEAALRDFVAKAGIQFPIDEINFTAGRGKDGLTATIDLEDPFSAMLDNVTDTPAEKALKAQPTVTRKDEEPEPAPEKEPEPEPEAQDTKPATQAPPFSMEEEADAPVAEKPAPAPKKEKASLFS